MQIENNKQDSLRRQTIDVYASARECFYDLDLSTHDLEKVIISSPDYSKHKHVFG